jgi:hypothetical protein
VAPFIESQARTGRLNTAWSKYFKFEPLVSNMQYPHNAPGLHVGQISTVTDRSHPEFLASRRSCALYVHSPIKASYALHSFMRAFNLQVMEVGVSDPSKDGSTAKAWSSVPNELAPEGEAQISHWGTTLRDFSALLLPYFLGMCTSPLKERSRSFFRTRYCHRTFLALQPSRPKAHRN